MQLIRLTITAILLLSLVKGDDVTERLQILHNIQNTRLGLCGCDIATTEADCFGPCKWANGACAKDSSFLPPENDDEKFKAESSGDIKLSNDCTSFFDEETCVANRNHDALFCKWEESECVLTDCKDFGGEECLFIYFCRLQEEGNCQRCAGQSASGAVISLSIAIILAALY